LIVVESAGPTDSFQNFFYAISVAASKKTGERAKKAEDEAEQVEGGWGVCVSNKQAKRNHCGTQS
jgi:hypothetical protein